MDARLARVAAIFAALLCLGAGYRTRNFIVTAPSQPLAEQIGKQAEKYRRDLAIEWLGKPLPDWVEPCPITAQVSDNLGAGGATSFVFDQGQVFGWRMTIQGSQQRILDSVLPHEVTHTIFASHFRQPLPRWADEGACTTVEHASERNKQQMMLVNFLRTKRGIPFHQMFAMKEYPHDILPLYAQGHSLASFLVAQGGRKKFINYVAAGLQGEQWSAATKQFYGFSGLLELQNSWLAWVRQGSPASPTPKQPSPAGFDDATMLAQAPRPSPGPDLVVRGQSSDTSDVAVEPLVPVSRPGSAASRGAPTQLASAAMPRGERSVYAADQGWRAKGASKNQGNLATGAERSGPTYNQLTRPQGIEGSRQVILEWERGTSDGAATATPRAAAVRPIAPRPPLPEPLDETEPPQPRRSVYDVRVREPGVMLR